MFDCHVYWIRHKDHSDISTEGYVGVSEDIQRRFNSHRKSGKYIVHKAIRKYQDSIVYESVYQSSRSNCLRLEKLLRPRPYIGWNISVGGQSPAATASDSLTQSLAWKSKNPSRDVPSFESFLQSLSKQVDQLQEEYDSIGHAESLSANHRKKFSIQKKIANLREGPWGNSQASDLWENADLYYDLWVKDGMCGSRRLSRLAGFNTRVKTLTNMVQYFEKGWVPQKDTRWLLYAKTKT